MQNKCALRAKSPEQAALTLGGAWDNTGDGVHTYALCVDCFCRQSIQQTVVRLSLRSTGLYNFMPDGTRKCDLYIPHALMRAKRKRYTGVTRTDAKVSACSACNQAARS